MTVMASNSGPLLLPRTLHSLHFLLLIILSTLLPQSSHCFLNPQHKIITPFSSSSARQLPPPSFSLKTNPAQQYQTTLQNSENDETEESDGDVVPIATIDPTVKRAALSLRGACLLSWWAQVILTTVSSVTLLFARSVRDDTGPLSTGSGSILAGTGIVISFLSIIWTYGGRRLSRRLLRRNTPPSEASSLLRRAVTVGVSINLLGMLVTLLGAELIVGVLAAKVLTVQGVGPFGVGAAGSLGAAYTLQPLDILIVQANTNTLLSHFCGLWLRLWYGRRWIGRLEDGREEK